MIELTAFWNNLTKKINELTRSLCIVWRKVCLFLTFLSKGGLLYMCLSKKICCDQSSSFMEGPFWKVLMAVFFNPSARLPNMPVIDEGLGNSTLGIFFLLKVLFALPFLSTGLIKVLATFTSNWDPCRPNTMPVQYWSSYLRPLGERSC